MKSKRLNLVGAAFVRALEHYLQLSFCVISLVWMSGCATSNYKKGDAASYSLHRAAIEINAENRAINVAMASLDDLINKPSGDLRPQFERFDVSLNQLIDASDRAEKAAAQANKKSEEYFKAWDQDSHTIVYEAVRDQSVARRAQVSDDFNTVNERYHQNQGVVEPLITYLRDIRTALSTDLTPGGIESVKPLAANARQNAKKVQMALAQLSADLAASGTRMLSAVPPEPQGQGGAGDGVQSSQQRVESVPSGQQQMTNAQQ